MNTYNDYVIATVIVLLVCVMFLNTIFGNNPRIKVKEREICKYHDGTNICTLEKGHHGSHATRVSMYKDYK